MGTVQHCLGAVTIDFQYISRVGEASPPLTIESFQLLDKPIGASPRRNKDGTILVCSTYSTYTVRIGTSKKGGNLRATDKKSTYVGGKYFNPPQAPVLV